MTDGARKGSLGAFRHRDFAVFWTAATISNAGSWMQVVAVPALLYDMTNSSSWLGISSMASLLPAVVLTPYAGTLADRLPRRSMLLATQSAQMSIAIVLWMLYVGDVISPGWIVALGFCNGVATGFQTAAWQAFVPLLVPPSHLLDAVKLNSVQFTMARAIGPAVAGVTVTAWGTGAAIGVNAMTYALVIAALVIVRPRATPLTPAGVSWRDALADGASFVWRHRPLRLAVMLSFATAACGQSFQHISAAVSSRIFDRPSTDNAGLLVALGIGAIISSGASVLTSDSMIRSRRVLLALSLYTACALIVPATDIYAVGLFGYFLGGLGHLQMAVALNTLIQGTVPEALRGRVTSFYLLGILGGIPVGALALGTLGDAFGLRVALVGNAVVIVAIGVALVSSGWLRSLNVTSIDDDREQRSEPCTT